MVFTTSILNIWTFILKEGITVDKTGGAIDRAPTKYWELLAWIQKGKDNFRWPLEFQTWLSLEQWQPMLLPKNKKQKQKQQLPMLGVAKWNLVPPTLCSLCFLREKNAFHNARLSWMQEMIRRLSWNGVAERSGKYSNYDNANNCHGIASEIINSMAPKSKSLVHWYNVPCKYSSNIFTPPKDYQYLS